MKQKTNDIEPDLLRAADAARRLGVSLSALDKARGSGLLLGVSAPLYVKIGRSIRYAIIDLDQWRASLPKFNNSAQEFVANQNQQKGA